MLDRILDFLQNQGVAAGLIGLALAFAVREISQWMRAGEVKRRTIRSLYAEIDHICRRLEKSIDEPPDFARIEEKLSDANYKPHIIVSVHTRIYRSNLQNLHCFDNDDLHKIVYLYSQIENFCAAIDSISLPSFATIDDKNKMRAIHFILDGMTECHDMGCDLLKSLERKYPSLDLRRFPPPASE